MTIEIMEAPPGVVACKMTGTVTASDYDELINAVERSLDESKHVSFYADVSASRI